MMPPLRKQKDTDLLWEGILNGKIEGVKILVSMESKSF